MQSGKEAPELWDRSGEASRGTAFSLATYRDWRSEVKGAFVFTGPEGQGFVVSYSSGSIEIFAEMNGRLSCLQSFVIYNTIESVEQLTSVSELVFLVRYKSAKAQVYKYDIKECLLTSVLMYNSNPIENWTINPLAPAFSALTEFSGSNEGWLISWNRVLSSSRSAVLGRAREQAGSWSGLALREQSRAALGLLPPAPAMSEPCL